MPKASTKEGVSKTLLALWLATMLPTLVQAQFIFTTNNGAITITDYTGPGGSIAIPATIAGSR